jgi:hypothetical protein
MLCSRNRILRVEPVDRDLDLASELLELLYRRRALQVARHESGPFSLLPQKERQLGRGRRLARPLEPGEEDHGRGSTERQPRVPGPHERGELLVDDLDHLLAGREALEHVLPERTLFDRGREALRNLEVDVRLEERESHLAHGLRDRLLIEPSAPAKVAERALKPVGERVEHRAEVYAEAFVLFAT